MEFEIKKLTPGMQNEYIDFFENRGLVKGDRNEGCYCVWHHWTDEQEMNRSKLPINEQPNVKRNYAIELIKAGKLNGFAAFQNEKMIGFCNADTKENYYRLSRENYPNSWNGLENNDKVLSIVCFVIDVGMRGQGVATALLKEIMNYAVVHNFDYMEAYPSAGEFNTANCCGPVSMYEKQGFSIIHNNNSGVVVRKKARHATI